MHYACLAFEPTGIIGLKACFVCLSSSNEKPEERGSYQGCYCGPIDYCQSKAREKKKAGAEGGYGNHFIFRAEA